MLKENPRRHEGFPRTHDPIPEEQASRLHRASHRSLMPRWRNRVFCFSAEKPDIFFVVVVLLLFTLAVRRASETPLKEVGPSRATDPLRTIAKNAMTIRSIIIRRRRPACIGVPLASLLSLPACACMCRRNTYAQAEEEVEEEGCAAGLARLREWVHRTPAAANLPLRLLGETQGVHRRGHTLLSLSLFPSFFRLTCILLCLSLCPSNECARKPARPASPPTLSYWIPAWQQICQ